MFENGSPGNECSKKKLTVTIIQIVTMEIIRRLSIYFLISALLDSDKGAVERRRPRFGAMGLAAGSVMQFSEGI